MGMHRRGLVAGKRTLALGLALGSALGWALGSALGLAPVSMEAQQAKPQSYQAAGAYPLMIDRGTSGLWQSLQKLKTRASLMMVVAHPDDEDSGMLAYEARGNGVDTSLLTLNRGEGGQNVMTGNFWDELGIMRTQELLAAGEYFGVHQYFTRVADYGFSKTLEEALQQWGHDRVLADVVRQVRISRPLVINSVFAGNVSDGHGHHQAAGVMAQEAYKYAGDPKMFPEQIAAGLRPWTPLKVYARVPFAIVQDGRIFDYATGHWEPVHYKNYVTGTFFEGVPKATVMIPEGGYNPLFGRNYLAVAREGLNLQKSQNGGVAVPLAKPVFSPYHLYASRVTGSESGSLPSKEDSFFDGIDLSLGGIAGYAPAAEQGKWKDALQKVAGLVDQAVASFNATDPSKSAPALAKGLQATRSLRAEVAASRLNADAKYNMDHELGIKETEFNVALGQSLGMAVLASVTSPNAAARFGPFGDATSTPTYQTAIPGQRVSVNVHVTPQGSQPVEIVAARVVATDGTDWKLAAAKPLTGQIAGGDAADEVVAGVVPADAAVTRPYFSRPSLEQPYYDLKGNLQQPQYLGLPTMPYPLVAQVEYRYGGVTAEVRGVVQTIHRMNGSGPMLEPLLVAPAISVRVTPLAGVIPIDGTTVKVHVLGSSVKGPAQGEVKLNLPAGWASVPEVAQFATSRDGDEQEVDFTVTPKNVQATSYDLTAVATYAGKQYTEGFLTIGYPGLRPYPMYRKAEYRATGVDLKVAPGLKVAYIAGSGDDVPSSLANIGVPVTQLSAEDIASADLTGYDAIVLGVRTYAARPELARLNGRLLEYVKNGGVVVTQYQTSEYDHNYGPYPISVPGDAEKVVDEHSKVQILVPNDPLLNWPNQITTADFDNWVEERGHGFAKTWDPQYVALTEMHDPGQDPQKGGLLYAPYGKGYYVYLAFAFFRELPEGVPGAFRIMANVISANKNPQFLRKDLIGDRSRVNGVLQ